MLEQVKEVGFSGILNCPTLSCVDGSFRVGLEETGLGYPNEVEMIRLARERDLFTHAFCSTVEEAVMMVEVGCDMVVAHMGNTSGGTTGAKTATSLEDAVVRTQAICDASKALNPDVRVLLSTGHALDGAAQELLDDGVRAFIGKPYGVNELSRAVRKALEGDADR